MDFDTKFGTIWLPELDGLLYGKDREGLIAGPQFFDKYDATVAYEEYISRWNQNSVNIIFIEDARVIRTVNQRQILGHQIFETRQRLCRRHCFSCLDAAEFAVRKREGGGASAGETAAPEGSGASAR